MCLCQLLGLPAALGLWPHPSSRHRCGHCAVCAWDESPRLPHGDLQEVRACWVNQDSLPQLKTLNFITSAKSTLPCKGTLTGCGL